MPWPEGQIFTTLELHIHQCQQVAVRNKPLLLEKAAWLTTYFFLIALMKREREFE